MDKGWLGRLFSTGDLIAITGGVIGMLAAFFALQGDAAMNTTEISHNRTEIKAVEVRHKQSIDLVRRQMNRNDERNEQRYESLDSKLDVLIQRSK